MNLNAFCELLLIAPNIKHLLTNFNTPSQKGYAFERLCDILIKFNCVDKFQNNKHLTGNFNLNNLKILTSLQQYIINNKLQSSSSTGSSDITLYDEETKTYKFISCKYPVSPEDIKNIKYYDIQDIRSVILKYPKTYINYEIFLCVPNKNILLANLKNAHTSSKHLTESIKEENIIDEEYLNKSLKQFQIKLKDVVFEDYDKEFCNDKINLKLRMHQVITTNKIINLIKLKYNNILIAWQPRSGKSILAASIISSLYKNIKNINTVLNILIITPAPNETVPQYTDDLFLKYIEFNNFTVIYLTARLIKDLDILLTKKNIILVASKQFLQNYINKDTLMQIKNLKLDLIFFDENHFGGTTSISDDILSSYCTQDITTKIYLTATYNKTLLKYNIPQEAQFYWSTEDVMLCKKHDVKSLIEKHDTKVDNFKIDKTKVDKEMSNYFLNNKDNKDIFDCYQNTPELHIITNIFDQERYELIKLNIKDTQYGFSFVALFSFETVTAKSFQYDHEVTTFLSYISGSQRTKDFKQENLSIFARIKKICDITKSRKPLTQLWFLPPDNIHKTSLTLEKHIKKDLVLKDYNVLILNSYVNVNAKDIKDIISKEEDIVRSENKQGLLILVGNMLSLGITLEYCDVVMLFHDGLSCDKITQQSYRCMTESKLNDKKVGIVVDLNIGRVLNTSVTYTIYKKDLTLEDKFTYLIKNHLINIDVDLCLSKEISTEILINKLLESWKSNPIHSFKNLFTNLDNCEITLDTKTQTKINTYFFLNQNSKIKNLNQQITFKDDDNELQEIQNGQEIIKEIKEVKDIKTKNKIINISFTKDVLPSIIPLVSILTLHYKHTNLIEMLLEIHKDKTLLEIFNDQTVIWWEYTDLLDFIRDIIEKHYNKNLNNIPLQFKMSLTSLIDDPPKLLELIDDCLKPKTVEKKMFGEVFTPMSLVNEMLDKLPNNVWLNKDLKWLDPAAGMGNFSVAIYLRLMVSLKEVIKDEKLRKKHILENMLYAIELNKKNVFIYRQIFDINNEYKLNIKEGDSLIVDLVKTFKVAHFDIIIGNPPYNKEFNKAGATPIYNKFIERYINKCNYLMFITPSRWFSGGKGLDTFRQFMLSRTDLRLINHFDDASIIFGNVVDIKGGVNYFLKDITYNSNTCLFNNSLMVLNKYDVFVENKYYELIDKLVKYVSLTTIYLGRHFCIESNDKRLVNNNNKDNLLLTCYVSKQKGFIKYIDKKEITKDYNFYKLVTARAAFQHKSGFGNMFICNTKEVHTGTYVSFKLNTKLEADSLLSYMKCKLPNLMLSLRKSAQDISESTCTWIPLVPLNKLWTDDLVHSYFKLTNKEILLVKNSVVYGYKDIITDVVEDVEDVENVEEEVVEDENKEYKEKNKELTKQQINDIKDKLKEMKNYKEHVYKMTPLERSQLYERDLELERISEDMSRMCYKN
jgi:site-specific DNA-methyltransferase (adenine-specific)